MDDITTSTITTISKGLYSTFPDMSAANTVPTIINCNVKIIQINIAPILFKLTPPFYRPKEWNALINLNDSFIASSSK